MLEELDNDDILANNLVRGIGQPNGCLADHLASAFGTLMAVSLTVYDHWSATHWHNYTFVSWHVE